MRVGFRGWMMLPILNICAQGVCTRAHVHAQGFAVELHPGEVICVLPWHVSPLVCLSLHLLPFILLNYPVCNPHPCLCYSRILGSESVFPQLVWSHCVRSHLQLITGITSIATTGISITISIVIGVIINVGIWGISSCESHRCRDGWAFLSVSSSSQYVRMRVFCSIL